MTPAKAPSNEGGGSERRTNPVLRPAVQAVFDRLLTVLRKARRSEVLDLIGGAERVDDVLRNYPDHVPTFLELAWQLRAQPDFVVFFRASGSRGDGPVQDRSTPIAPCDLTFDQIGRSLLTGAARLVFERRERAWAERRAKQEAARRSKRREAGAKGPLSSRLISPLKTMFEGDHDLDPAHLRAHYPGHGLFAVLRPYLVEPWQFAFLEQYARLGTAQAKVLGHLIWRVRAPEMLETLISLDVEELSVIQAACRAFAETTLGVPPDQGPRWELKGKAARDRDRIEEQIAAEVSTTLDAIVLRHPGALDAIREMGLSARREVRRLTQVYGADIWMVFEQPDRLHNARNVPDHLLRVLGPLCHRVPPDVSAILGHIRDRTLARDLITLAREDLGDEVLAGYLADPVRKPIWNTLPAKFNNAYKYQPDATPGLGAPNNRESLRLIGAGIFQSLRLGHLEIF
ncbi:hypothetical protein F1188_11445 [Roseospira marina]|uniref:Uncharacterized protein n=1 Tax=Roseospira marina TaxID=140057 RepID=A0A5M6IB86_9PROT|nr:hypothetical protein [Roseospira marina]KAA5605501.1 hypothetical protein F1188_11445 [Roseospira marina]MBB4314495.1 hypothetical protein [Roseospira marina]MBB5088677.1 hypothetical protein [Roseospira marina]